jgi:hypothetical protein
MDQLNNKVSATQDEVKFTAQNVGVYGYDSTTQGGKWRRVNADPSGQLHVAVAQHLVDSPDLKARTNIADPTTSTFLKCNTDGTLEMTAELSTAGLATEAKQDAGNNTLSSIDNKIILPSVLNSDQLKVNDSAVVGSLSVLNNNITTGNQASKSMGNNSGSQVQIKVDTNGVQEVSGTVSATISGVSTEAKQDTINGTIGDTNSKIDAMRASDSLTTVKDSIVQNLTDGSTKAKAMGATAANAQYQLRTDTDGHLQVDVLTNALPTGAATEATLSAAQVHLGAIDTATSSIQSNVATSANQTNGTQKAMCMGNNSGSQVQIKVDSNGVVETSGGGGSGGTQFAGGDSLAATGTGTAMIGRDSGGVARLVAMDTSGNLQVDIVANSDTTKATSTLQTSGNTTLTSIDGKVATETTLAAVEAHQGNIENNLSSIQSTVSSNKLQVDVITSALPTGAATQTTLAAAESHLGTIDTSTASLAGCVSGTEVQVDIVSQPSRTTASPQVLYTGGSAVIASGGSNFQDFTNGTIGGATFNQLDVDGLGNVQYIIEGVGTSPQLTISELVGASSGTLFVNSAQQFAFNNDDFAVIMVDSTARHRGLRIINTSGANSYTVNKITAIYHTP